MRKSRYASTLRVRLFSPLLRLTASINSLCSFPFSGRFGFERIGIDTFLVYSFVKKICGVRQRRLSEGRHEQTEKNAGALPIAIPFIPYPWQSCQGFCLGTQ